MICAAFQIHKTAEHYAANEATRDVFRKQRNDSMTCTPEEEKDIRCSRSNGISPSLERGPNLNRAQQVNRTRATKSVSFELTDHDMPPKHTITNSLPKNSAKGGNKTEQSTPAAEKVHKKKQEFLRKGKRRCPRKSQLRDYKFEFSEEHQKRMKTNVFERLLGGKK